MRKLLFMCVLLAGGVAQAATVTVDFQEYCCAPGGGIIAPAPDPVTAQGFTFGGGYLSNGFGSGSDFAYYADTHYSPSQDIYGSTMGFERTDGEAFALYSLNWELFNGYYEEAYYLDYIDVDFVGYLAGGGTVVTSDLTDFGQGDWLNIVGVDIWTAGPSASIDPDWAYHTSKLNSMVVGAAVPVPAAVWLFGSALAGLGFVRRNQLNQQ
jgi:hypothetical protein